MISNFKFQISNSEKGFSLIELAIVLTIFLIIVGAMVNMFVSLVSNQKKISGQQELLRQAGFVMEYLATSLPVAAPDPDGSCLGVPGRVYLLTHCPEAPGKACGGISFINPLDNNACTKIFIDPSKNPTNPSLVVVKNNGAPQLMVSSALRVVYARFIINGDKTLTASTAASQVPTLTIALSVSAGPGQPEKIIQTTVSHQ